MAERRAALIRRASLERQALADLALDVRRMTARIDRISIMIRRLWLPTTTLLAVAMLLRPHLALKAGQIAFLAVRAVKFLRGT